MKAPKFRLHIDSLIMGAAAVVLLVSVYFLFQDGSLMDDGANGNLKPVGTFKTSTNDVRRRVDAGMTWSGVDAPTKVYEGDSIFTGDKSEASIQLDNGTILKVDPKSLVVIHTVGNHTEIDLQYGSMQGKIASNEPIIIKQDGKSQELSGQSGAQIRIVRHEKEKAVRVQVEKGSVKVDNENVQVDEVVKFTQNKPVIEKSTLTLLSPSNGETKWLPLGASLNFKWRATGSAAKERSKIEFAKDASFASPFYAAETTGDHFAVADSNIPVGSFNWRVKPANGEPSLAMSATVYPDVPPLPVLPKDQQVYMLDTDKGENSKTVFLTWEDKAGSVDFDLQVARDADFKQILKTKTGKEKVERVADLATGDYYWHVKGRHPDRANAPYSRAMKFTIRDGVKAPGAPVLSSNEINYTIPEATLAKVTAQQAASGRGVRPDNITPFSWPKADNASTYEVEVSVDPTFANGVRQDNGAATSFTPKEVRPGKLYFRARAQSVDGRMSGVSKTAVLNVSLPAPRMAPVRPVVATFKSEKDAKSAQAQFNLAWTPQRYASSYELQWGSDPQFSKSKTFRIKETSRALKVSKPDSYAARVRSLDADGQPISAFSPVSLASFAKHVVAPTPIIVKKEIVQPKPRVPASTEKVAGLMPALPTPHLREPASNSALVSLEDAPTFVAFKWQPYKNATSYTIQISSDADFTKVVGEQKVNSTGYVFQKGLPEGKVFWRVRANVKGGFSNWSDPSDINVIYQ